MSQPTLACGQCLEEFTYAPTLTSRHKCTTHELVKEDYLSLYFCSGKCFKNHILDYHNSIDLI